MVIGAIAMRTMPMKQKQEVPLMHLQQAEENPILCNGNSNLAMTPSFTQLEEMIIPQPPMEKVQEEYFFGGKFDYKNNDVTGDLLFITTAKWGNPRQVNGIDEPLSQTEEITAH